MTGGRGNRSIAKCAVCGGSLTRGKADMPFSMDSGLLLVKGVPAEICGDCGEPYLSGPTVDRVTDIVRGFEQLATEISVVSYRAA